MSNTSVSMTDPLLTAVTNEQLALLRIVGDVLTDIGEWPVYQYVEARMDELGLDADAVLRSMPSISDGQLSYSLVRRDHSTAPDTLVKLTIAGFAHLPAHAGVWDMFLAVLNELSDRRVKAAYDPRQVIEVTLSGPDLLSDLGLQDEPLVRLLPEILRGEPSTWQGGGNVNGGVWMPAPSTFVRRFRNVSSVDEYLHRLRGWIEPARQPAAVLASPLSLVGALDYLDVVWRLRFGAGLLVVPSAERAARLAFDATTAEELDNRLSALGEMFKGFDVPGDQQQGTLRRLRVFLADHLTAEAMVRVESAVTTLQNVTYMRNAGQHMDAALQAAEALRSFGLTYPISDIREAWQTVQTHVVSALGALREEVQATLPAPGARRSQARRPRRHTSSNSRRGVPPQAP
ncbi:hypothetical protein GA0070613_6476 [Micromonospora inositola]|uniref:Uncharacterized protein n=2 Tax=Micromonospora inositola TaxID=47865 RepID=A0A1C5K5S2_9ACTN|nr:hypothetical protein GA0070613_6476 [Micromonospora inositola]